MLLNMYSPREQNNFLNAKEFLKKRVAQTKRKLVMLSSLLSKAKLRMQTNTLFIGFERSGQSTTLL